MLGPVRTTLLGLFVLFVSGCYSPTAGWNPPCYAIPAEERTPEGKPRIICKMPSTAASRERDERRADLDWALRRAEEREEREDHGRD
jgi:hypothetical protein